MDEEKKIEPNIIDVLKEKAAIEGQLDSFINPVSRPKNESINATSYYSGAEIKTEPLIKIKEEMGIVTPEVQKQTRPIIRTYKSDVEETIQTGHISSINIALAENKKMLGHAKNTSVEEKKKGINKNILILSIVLVVGGVLTFLIPQMLFQMKYGVKSAPVETVDSRPLMTVDVQEKINIKDIDLNRVSTTLMERVIQSATSLGQIKNIYLTEGTSTVEKLITSSRFLQLINANAPDELLRTLKDPYMFGLHNYNGNQTFLILKVSSYDTTYSGMLQWETNLWQDFKILFNLPEDSTSVVPSYGIEIKKFQDATFDNKDCRVVKDEGGNIIFLYSIIDENTIVITTSIDTLKEIISRVSKARVVTQ